MKPLAPWALFNSLPLDPDLFALAHDAGNALPFTRMKKLLVRIAQWLGYERIYLAHNASKQKPATGFNQCGFRKNILFFKGTRPAYLTAPSKAFGVVFFKYSNAFFAEATSLENVAGS